MSTTLHQQDGLVLHTQQLLLLLEQYLIAVSDEEEEDGLPVFSGVAGAGGPEVVAVCRRRPAGDRQGRR